MLVLTVPSDTYDDSTIGSFDELNEIRDADSQFQIARFWGNFGQSYRPLTSAWTTRGEGVTSW